jgi:drug/metabolite transporter (DMT)-like permease
MGDDRGDNLTRKISIGYAFLAAALYAISSPISKLLLEKLSPTLLAAFLYLGAGIGILMLSLATKITKKETTEQPLVKKDLPYIIGMIILDVAAPILLMIGLTMTSAANASLLNNFEIVATSIIALFLFHEKISKRLWIAIAFVTISSILISVNGTSSFTFSRGSLYVLLACACWGLENNCTRMLADKNPLHTVIIKGFFSGSCSLLIGLFLGERVHNLSCIIVALILGFVSYGLSIYFYIHAQRYLGASKTSTYYAIAPFFGAILSLFIFREMPGLLFIFAFFIMLLGAYLASTDEIKE